MVTDLLYLHGILGSTAWGIQVLGILPGTARGGGSGGGLSLDCHSRRLRPSPTKGGGRSRPLLLSASPPSNHMRVKPGTTLHIRVKPGGGGPLAAEGFGHSYGIYFPWGGGGCGMRHPPGLNSEPYHATSCHTMPSHAPP